MVGEYVMVAKCILQDHVHTEIEQHDCELLMYLVYISVYTETECMDAMNLCAWFNEPVEQDCDLLELRPR